LNRKICIVTGGRAEYDLLYWLMKEVQNDSDLCLQIVVTGMHLSPEFGLTYRQIEQDGFVIDVKVESVLSSDTPVGISKSIALGVIGFAEAWERLKPDLIVVLGDRYEILAAVQAALIARIPVAHLHGGEITEGSIDDAIRHSITKMSHLHFVSAQPYADRVIQLGENPDSVFNVGAPGLEAAAKIKLLTLESLEAALDFRLGNLNFLVTYHPVTLQVGQAEAGVRALLEALDEFPKAHIIFTKPNSDTEGRVIGEMIDKYVQANDLRSKSFFSLGQLRYFSTLTQVDVAIGNSSSGIVEAPSFKKATVNIGSRQKGRLKALSVIDCVEEKDSILTAIQKALSSDFQKSLKQVTSPYGTGDTSIKIKNIFKTTDLSQIIFKKFHDLPYLKTLNESE
jgi:UDP-N-acetylglucosamine 2-epimerase (non-hydrolysing)/GDP/UDP-N,N'-diacetylbacillosamine 2-epimerase (hydrolysing)